MCSLAKKLLCTVSHADAQSQSFVTCRVLEEYFARTHWHNAPFPICHLDQHSTDGVKLSLRVAIVTWQVSQDIHSVGKKIETKYLHVIWFVSQPMVIKTTNRWVTKL